MDNILRPPCLTNSKLEYYIIHRAVTRLAHYNIIMYQSVILLPTLINDSHDPRQNVTPLAENSCLTNIVEMGFRRTRESIII